MEKLIQVFACLLLGLSVACARVQGISALSDKPELLLELFLFFVEVRGACVVNYIEMGLVVPPVTFFVHVSGHAAHLVVETDRR